MIEETANDAISANELCGAYPCHEHESGVHWKCIHLHIPTAVI